MDFPIKTKLTWSQSSNLRFPENDRSQTVVDFQLKFSLKGNFRGVPEHFQFNFFLILDWKVKDMSTLSSRTFSFPFLIRFELTSKGNVEVELPSIFH